MILNCAAFAEVQRSSFLLMEKGTGGTLIFKTPSWGRITGQRDVLIPLKRDIFPVLTLLEFLALPCQVFPCLTMTPTLARAASSASWPLAGSR